MADSLRASKVEVKTLERGTQELRKQDRRIGRMTLAGKEVFKGVKVGTKIMESKGLNAKIARELDKKLNAGKERATMLNSPIRAAATAQLRKIEGFKEAGFIKSTIATTEMRFKSHAAEKAAIEKLQQRADAGKKIEGKEREVTNRIKEASVKAVQEKARQAEKDASMKKAAADEKARSSANPVDQMNKEHDQKALQDKERLEVLKKEVKEVEGKIEQAKREGNPDKVEKLSNELAIKNAEIADKSPKTTMDKINPADKETQAADKARDQIKAAEKEKERITDKSKDAKKKKEANPAMDKMRQTQQITRELIKDATAPKPPTPPTPTPVMAKAPEKAPEIVRELTRTFER